MGVEKGVCLFAERLAEILLVHLYNALVLVALSKRHVLVFLVDCLLAGLDNLEVSVMERLSAAADAAARAGHDLDYVVLALAGPDLFHQFAGVTQAVGDGNVEGKAVEIDGTMTSKTLNWMKRSIMIPILLQR